MPKKKATILDAEPGYIRIEIQCPYCEQQQSEFVENMQKKFDAECMVCEKLFTIDLIKFTAENNFTSNKDFYINSKG